MEQIRVAAIEIDALGEENLANVATTGLRNIRLAAIGTDGLDETNLAEKTKNDIMTKWKKITMENFVRFCWGVFWVILEYLVKLLTIITVVILSNYLLANSIYPERKDEIVHG